MGVSLSLSGTREARSRKRGGQHTRTTEEQACLDALAAFLRSDAAGAGRCLTKVSTASLAARLLPAAQALARAADLALAGESSAACLDEPDFVLSPVCLLGLCGSPAGRALCPSAYCQHACHAAITSTAAGPSPGSAASSARGSA
jgi:hypothetical protein